MKRTCPACDRPHAGRRDACMYCGEPLASHVDAQDASERSLPPDLDVLFRRAMMRQDVGALQAAMEDHQAAPQELLEPEDLPESALAQDSSRPAPDPVDIASALDQIVRGAEAARSDWSQGHVEAVREWLSTARLTLDDLAGRLPPHAEGPSPRAEESAAVVASGPSVVLPKVRHAAALIVEGLGDADRAEDLAACLDIDVATARLFAVSRHPRVVLRSSDKVRLSARAEQIRTAMGVRAAVFDREGLLAVGPAPAVKRAVTSDPLTIEVVDLERWDAEDPQVRAGHESRVLALEPLLLVPGEVVIQCFRVAPQNSRLKHLREHRVIGAGEHRVAVLDIHSASGVFRVSEGHTTLDGFAGFHASSFRRSLRDLIEASDREWPAAQRIVHRVCQASLTAGGGVGAGGGAVKGQDTGWPVWEEHSRACRLLYAVPSG